MLCLTSGCGFLGSATTNCGVLSTTRTVAGTSANTLSPCFTTTVASLSPIVVVSTGSLYSYVASSGKSSESTLFFASGWALDSLTGTICGTPAITFTVISASFVYSTPSTTYVTGTLTVPLPSPLSAVIVANTSSVIAPTPLICASFGNCALKSAEFTTSSAFAFVTSLSLSTVVPFVTVTSSLATGNTVTGTLTVSVSLIPSYVTGTVASLFPALAVISSATTGSPFVPSVPAVTAPFTSSFVTVSPSNTTNFLAVEPTTVTGTVTSLVATTLPSFTYSTTAVAGVCSPVVDVAGTVPALTSLTLTVTPSGNLSVGTALAASTAFALTASSRPVLSLRTFTPVGSTFGKTTTSTLVSTGIVSVPLV